MRDRPFVRGVIAGAVAAIMSVVFAAFVQQPQVSRSLRRMSQDTTVQVLLILPDSVKTKHLLRFPTDAILCYQLRP